MTAPRTAERTAHRLWATAAGLESAIGLGFTLAPRRLLGIFGLPAHEVTDTAAAGWQLFGVRNLVMGVAALRGSDAARRSLLPVQLLDQVVLGQALVTRPTLRRASAQALGTAVAVTALTVAASRAQRPRARRA